MENNNVFFFSNCHNLIVGVICMFSFFAYLFLNTQSWQADLLSNPYASQELKFGNNSQEFDKMPAQSIVTFIFEQTKHTFSQIISKRLK